MDNDNHLRKLKISSIKFSKTVISLLKCRFISLLNCSLQIQITVKIGLAMSMLKKSLHIHQHYDCYDQHITLYFIAIHYTRQILQYRI